MIMDNPYRPPAAELDSGVGSDSSAIVLASRSSRLGAALFDLFTWILALLPLGIGAALSGAGALETEMYGTLGVGVVLLFVIGGLNIAWVAQNGQTIGKRLMGIRVVRTDGSGVSLSRIFLLRNVLPGFIVQIPFLGGVFWLVDHLYIFGEHSRCLHDLMADTTVIKVMSQQETARMF